jgi:hypothetical protein
MKLPQPKMKMTGPSHLNGKAMGMAKKLKFKM